MTQMAVPRTNSTSNNSAVFDSTRVMNSKVLDHDDREVLRKVRETDNIKHNRKLNLLPYYSLVFQGSPCYQRGQHCPTVNKTGGCQLKHITISN